MAGAAVVEEQRHIDIQNAGNRRTVCSEGMAIYGGGNRSTEGYWHSGSGQAHRMLQVIEEA